MSATVCGAPPSRPARAPKLSPLLLAPTPAHWVEHALADLGALLADHAHCERKAAGQAMALATAHAEKAWLVAPMVRLAREELRHLETVLAALAAHGGLWGPDAGDPYARALHQAAPACLAGRLLVAAFIEARSCERMQRLARALGDASPLGRMWHRLAVAEAGHHRLFLRLAARTLGDPVALERHVAELARREVELSTLHSRLARMH